MSLLHEIVEHLYHQRRELQSPYFVPGLWVGTTKTEAVQVDPYEFYGTRLTEIVNSAPQPLIQGTGGGEWSRNAIIYNLFPRLTTAFDHNDDNHLSIDGNGDGWR